MLYHFHIRDQGTLIRDDEGSDLPDMTAAQVEARASARDLAMEDLRHKQPIQDRHIEIVDDRGTVLESVAVRSVLN